MRGNLAASVVASPAFNHFAVQESDKTHAFKSLFLSLTGHGYCFAKRNQITLGNYRLHLDAEVWHGLNGFINCLGNRLWSYQLGVSMIYVILGENSLCETAIVLVPHFGVRTHDVFIGCRIHRLIIAKARLKTRFDKTIISWQGCQSLKITLGELGKIDVEELSELLKEADDSQIGFDSG